MIKNNVKTNDLIKFENDIIIYNILRDLGLMTTLKGTKLLNKAIQIVLSSDDEFVVLEDV